MRAPFPISAAFAVVLLFFASCVHGQGPSGYAVLLKDLVTAWPSGALDASTQAQFDKFTACLTKAGAEGDVSDSCGDCWADDGNGEGKKAMASMAAVLGKLGLDAKVTTTWSTVTAGFTICEQPYNVMSTYSTLQKCIGSTKTATKAGCECYQATTSSTMFIDWYSKSGLGAVDPIWSSCTAFTTWTSCMDKAPGGAGLTGGGLSAADGCKCTATCKSDAGCWAVAKESIGASIVESKSVVCAGMAVSPSFLLIAAFAAVLAGRGLFQ